MPKFKENVSLSEFSNYRIGGRARFFFAAQNEKEVVWAVAEAKARKLPVFILGAGTNLLIDDEGWDGLVLKPAIDTLTVKGMTMTAGAGVMMADLLNLAAKRSLAGLEWAGGLPGTVGGAIRGNAGCFGGAMENRVVSVRSFDMKRMVIRTRRAKNCTFKYRYSIFKKNNGAEVILSAQLRLAKSDRKKIIETMKKNIAHRNDHHPLDYPSVGSIFKNVPLSSIHKKGSVPYKEAVAGKALAFRGSRFSVKTDPFPVIAAAKLISEAGLAGVTCGGAMISPKHSNFIVNVLEAGSCDVKNLITLAKSEVYKKFGVRLEEEAELV